MEFETYQQKFCIPEALDDSFDPSIVPQDGQEYLKKVIYERNNCPVVAQGKPPIHSGNIDMKMFSDPIEDTSKYLHPTEDWKKIQMQHFELLRQKVINLKLRLEANGYTTNDNLPMTNDRDVWRRFCQDTPPLLSTVLRIDYGSLEDLLEFETYWLLNECTDESIDLIKNEAWLGTWIYSTLACFHTPIEPGSFNGLRDIAKACIVLRNKLSPDDTEKAIPLNLFILIIAKTFGQFDLFEYV